MVSTAIDASAVRISCRNAAVWKTRCSWIGVSQGLASPLRSAQRRWLQAAACSRLRLVRRVAEPDPKAQPQSFPSSFTHHFQRRITHVELLHDVPLCRRQIRLNELSELTEPFCPLLSLSQSLRTTCRLLRCNTAAVTCSRRLRSLELTFSWIIAVKSKWSDHIARKGIEAQCCSVSV